jgi:hypothetical protein
MIKKRYILTGIVEIGKYGRLVLYPDEPVKEKKKYDFMALAQSGDVAEMQQNALIESIIANTPPTLYITMKEWHEEKLKLDDHIIVTLEIE